MKKDIIRLTNYRFKEIIPRLKEKPAIILKKSFFQIDKIVEALHNDKGNYRDFIECCRKLKKSPAKYWYYRNIYRDRSVILKAFLPYENKNRRILLSQLRKKKTFTRFNKTERIFAGYPFRDLHHKNNDNLFYNYLKSKGIIPEHSGCVMCPIRLAYMINKNSVFDCCETRFFYNLLSRNDNNFKTTLSQKFFELPGLKKLLKLYS